MHQNFSETYLYPPPKTLYSNVPHAKTLIMHVEDQIYSEKKPDGPRVSVLLKIIQWRFSSCNLSSCNLTTSAGQGAAKNFGCWKFGMHGPPGHFTKRNLQANTYNNFDLIGTSSSPLQLPTGWQLAREGEGVAEEGVQKKGATRHAATGGASRTAQVWNHLPQVFFFCKEGIKTAKLN